MLYLMTDPASTVITATAFIFSMKYQLIKITCYIKVLTSHRAPQIN